MKPYIHNPTLFRTHFSGRGLPAFQGARMQRGRGVLSKKLKRFTVPLLKAGAKAATPYIAKAAGKVATTAAQRFFPGSPAMQKLVGKAATNATNHIIKKASSSKGLRGGGSTHKKRKLTRTANTKKKFRKTTRINIFE